MVHPRGLDWWFVTCQAKLVVADTGTTKYMRNGYIYIWVDFPRTEMLPILCHFLDNLAGLLWQNLIC